MKITLVTLFPEMFTGPFDHSIIKRAQEKNLITIDFVNIRDFGIGAHHVVDDTPYGGGAGMVLRVDVLDNALQKAKQHKPFDQATQKVALLDAQGETFSQKKATMYASLDHLILLAAHYEGVDERVKETLVDEIISVGDFVVTGGEIPAMLVADAVSRLIPGVIKEESSKNESFSPDTMLLEYPHYTKPQEYLGKSVPEILLQGNHAKIAAWRNEQALSRTKAYRPDLLAKATKKVRLAQEKETQKQ